MKIKTLGHIPVKGKRVLVRVDFNVPMENGAVTNDTRIKAALPTIRRLLEQNAKIILASHLGRPKGQANPKYSLAPVAKHLSRLWGQAVAFAADCVGPEAEKAVKRLKDGEILLLENLRFHPEEEKNDVGFAKTLSSLADVFIQDAFGVVHRAHASTAGITKFLPSAAGLLLQKELQFLEQIRESPAKPFVAIIGGAKVSDKIEVLDKLLDKVDLLGVGGAMAYTFLTALNVSVGNSLVEQEKVGLAKSLMEKAEKKRVTLLLPRDHLVVRTLEDEASARYTDGQAIPAENVGVDIGPNTLQRFVAPLSAAKTVFWNGPMGIFEVDRYATGTREVAKLSAEAAKRGAMVVVGGGDSAAAVQAAGLADAVTHISTGGGAALEFLEGKELPGVASLS